jgi:hypothetical protein
MKNKTVLLQEQLIIFSSIGEMKLDDIQKELGEFVASSDNKKDKKSIYRTEMEELTFYGDTRKMESFLKNHKDDLNLTKNQLLYINPYNKIDEIIDNGFKKFEDDLKEGKIDIDKKNENFFLKKQNVELDLFELWKNKEESRFEVTPIYDKDEFKFFISESHVNLSDNKIYELGEKFGIEVVVSDIPDMYKQVNDNGVDKIIDIQFKKGNIDYEILDYKKQNSDVSTLEIYRHETDVNLREGGISTLIFKNTVDPELNLSIKDYDSVLLNDTLINQITHFFPEYKEEIEDVIKNVDEIEKNDRENEVDILKKSVKERIYANVEKMEEKVSINDMNMFLEENTLSFLNKEFTYRDYSIKDEETSIIEIENLKKDIQKELPNISEIENGIKVIDTTNFKEKMEERLAQKEIEKEDKTVNKVKEKEYDRKF